MSGHAARNHRHAEDRPGPAQSRRRRPRGQRGQAAQGARRGGGARAPISSSSPSCSSPAIRPRTWCASRPSRPLRARRSRRWRPRPRDGGPGVLVGTIWAEDGKLYNAVALLDGGRIAGRALQGRPAQLRRVRREARVRRRADAGAGQLPRRAHRRADLRGHLEGGGVRVPAGDGLGDADLAQRLAVRLAQARPAHERRGGARDGDRAAAALRQPGRRPGRAGVRRRLLRAQRRSQPRRADAGLGGGDRRRRDAAHGGRLALRAGPSARCSRSTRRPPITPACWACATTSTRTAFPAWCWGCRAASTRRWSRPWRSMRWARSACTA